MLASLLLGYGLDAWVCFGADAVGQQTWVLTRSTKDTALFWDPSTGGLSNIVLFHVMHCQILTMSERQIQ